VLQTEHNILADSIRRVTLKMSQNTKRLARMPGWKSSMKALADPGRLG